MMRSKSRSAPPASTHREKEMPYPPWQFDVIPKSAIVDPGNEALCPNHPKIKLLETEKQFDDTIESTWDQFGLHKMKDIEDHTPGNAHNIQQILCLTLPNAHLCAYHLGRGMAAVALEVIGFPLRNQYEPLVAPMSKLMERVTIEAPSSYIFEAQKWFEDFMEAEACDGTQGFAARYRATEPVVKKKVRWWQRLIGMGI
jgi:hypothetical protein